MSVKHSKWLLIAATSAMSVISPTVRAFDPLRAEQSIPVNAAGEMVPSNSACEFGPLSQPLTLEDAVERALCRNPKTREAWADVKAQAAAVGVARAAYLPTITGNWQGVRDNSVTDITDHPTLSSNYMATVRSEGVSLNWLLYDFGGREAALKNVSSLLQAAQATQNATLQTTFANIAKDYYAAQASRAALDAAHDIEAMTRLSATAAQAKVDKGAVPITDALQAQTQHEQALLNLAKARSDARSTIGTLASDMGYDPSAVADVPAVTDTVPGNVFTESLARLIDEVKRTHPSVLAAQAQYDAAVAKVTQTRAQGLPSISLVGKYSRDNQPQSLGLGLPTYPSTGHDAYVGIQISIPIFEGFGRNYQIDQAQAVAERQHDTLEDARLKVGLDVWNSYYALEAASESAAHSASLLTIAQQAYTAAEHRYNVGVGNILELLNTQTTLANAKERRIQALTDWDNARIDLASKLGRLDLSSIRPLSNQ
ncbi:TolC family protein [Burkholderia cenocepacia]|uniref:TolC family protein n=1 Tax=Burkholderia cenocepacia TaxID=95486 RepID=UPI001B96A029|nr:TolC family protein [Burkholderia cenocepacia]MBR8484348.1 TolC family protein [Burkholderia cenocepacia]